MRNHFRRTPGAIVKANQLPVRRLRVELLRMVVGPPAERQRLPVRIGHDLVVERHLDLIRLKIVVAAYLLISLEDDTGQGVKGSLVWGNDGRAQGRTGHLDRHQGSPLGDFSLLIVVPRLPLVGRVRR